MQTTNRLSPFLATLATVPLALIAFLQPTIAAETTIGVCETNRDTVRVYSDNGQTKIRAYDRVNNVTWLNTAVSRSTTPEVVQFQTIRSETSVAVAFYRNSSSSCYTKIGGRVEDGRVIAGNPGGSGGSGTPNVPPAVAERACLNRAQQLGYRVFQQAAAQPTSTGYTMDLKGTLNGQQYPLKCTYISQTGNVAIEQILGSSTPGKDFYGIPRYGTVRAMSTGYNDVPAQNRRYFRVQLSNGSTTTWYANCRTTDQIYDSKSVYLGYNPNARAMLVYMCSFPSTRPPIQPR